MAGPSKHRALVPRKESGTSLIVEDGKAKHCQAQFSRFQHALGLSKALTDDDLKSYAYGHTLKPLKSNKPTGFDRKGGVVLIALHLDTQYESDMLVKVEWATRSFDTARLQGEPTVEYTGLLQKSNTFSSYRSTRSLKPIRQLQEPTLCNIRRAIIDAFGPTCRDHCERSIHRSKYSDCHHSAESLEVGDFRRALCGEALHDDRNNYDHSQHKTCKSRENIVLIVPNKESTLRALKVLGCDAHKHLHVVDVVSIEELHQAYLVRGDYNHRSPMTGDHRTKMHHNWNEASTVRQIATTLLPHHETETGTDAYAALNQKTFCLLKVAVEMAVRDALAPGWLRTREQIDGGAFPGLWLKLPKDHEVTAFLLEYDVSRSHASSQTTWKAKVDVLMMSFFSMSQETRETQVRRLAAIHKYGSLLPKGSTQRQSSSLRIATISSTRDAVGPSYGRVITSTNAVASRPSTRNAVGTVNRRVVTSTKAVATVATTTTVVPHVSRKITAMLALDEKPDHETWEHCRLYHEHQKAFERLLWQACSVSVLGSGVFYGMFDFVRDEHGQIAPAPSCCEDYEEIARGLCDIQGWAPDTKLTKTLKKTIHHREEAQPWYERLHTHDSRRNKIDGHRNFIDVLTRVYKILHPETER